MLRAAEGRVDNAVCPATTCTAPMGMLAPKWLVFKIRVPFGVLFIMVPYYIGDPRDPNLENYLAVISPAALRPWRQMEN